MDYYKLFNLEKEPFSNAPDPDFFYRSRMHAKCLMDLEIVLRLRRGLSIVHGEVGTGKTTLCRQLIRYLSDDDAMQVHLVLDPGYENTLLFAQALSGMIAGEEDVLFLKTLGECKERIKHHLFEYGVNRGKIIVLVIDEAQKLPGGCVEFLRELLNYETNEYKLLQIVLFAQDEIAGILDAYPNFADRVAFYQHLGPLDRDDTARLIRFRLQRARSPRDRTPERAGAPVFTAGAIRRIHRLTGGYPRKIIHLSHNVLLLLLVKGKNRATPDIVDQAARNLASVGPLGPGNATPRRRIFLRAGVVAAVAVVVAAVTLAGFVQFVNFSGSPAFLSGNQASRETGNTGNAEDISPSAGASADRGNARGGRVVSALPAPLKNPDPADAAVEPGNATGKPLPAILGEIRIRDNESLWRMMIRIYGSAGENLLERVRESNPDMDDPHLIRPGQNVAFPVLDMRPAGEKRHYRIALKKSADLESAYRFLASAEYAGLELVSFLESPGELSHAVVLKGDFADRNAAAAQLEEMPREIQDAAEVLNLGRTDVHMADLL